MLFSNLIGNPAAKQYLTRLIEKKRMPSTLLFSGPDGVGKSLFARELARELLGAKAAQKQEPADLHIYKGEEGSGMHSIESMRKLQEEVALPPFEAEASVFILENAERMLPTSANALLKTLEEPPEDRYFILLTSDSDKLLPTILSRCCKVLFFPVPQDELVDLVAKKYQKNKEEALAIARRAQGSVGRAIELAGQQENCKELVLAFFSSDYGAFVRAVKALEEKEDLNGEKVLDEIALALRDQHLIHAGGDPCYLFDKTPTAPPKQTLEKTLTLLAESRLALERHIKLRAILDRLYVACVP